MLQNNQLDGLIALKVVAEKRNFAAAAAAMGISPSAISQVIKQLESRMGVALLSRTTRSTRLTEAGERFLNMAGPAIDQILAAVDAVSNFGEKPSGLLRINCPKLIYLNYLSPLIKSFNKKYPEVTVEIYLEDQASDVIGNGFDAGIRLSDILVKDMIAIKLLGPVRFVTVASPKYLHKMGRPKHPEDLLSHNCLRMRLGGTNMYDNWEFEEDGVEFRVQVKGSLIFNDSSVVLDAARDGAGIMYVSEDSILKDVKAKKLEIILKNYASSSAGFYLYFAKRSQVLPKLRAFIDHIRDEGKVSNED